MQYLDPGLEVHHRDEDPMNDALDNLEVLTFAEHIAEHTHEKQKNFGDVLATEATITSVEYHGKEMTCDIVMADPYEKLHRT